MDPLTLLPTRRGSRAVPFEAAPSSVGPSLIEAAQAAHISSGDIESIVTGSTKYKELLQQNEKLQEELDSKIHENSKLREELKHLLKEQEKAKIKDTMNSISKDSSKKVAVPVTAPALVPASASQPGNETVIDTGLQSNFYHKLRLLAQVGSAGNGTMQTPEMRWIIQMAHDKHEENHRLRSQITEISRGREQMERSYQQEIDVLQSQLRSVGDKCAREKIMAERWFTKAELSRIKAERLVWEHKEEVQYRQKREETRVQASHLVNGLAVAIDKKQHGISSFGTPLLDHRNKIVSFTTSPGKTATARAKTAGPLLGSNSSSSKASSGTMADISKMRSTLHRLHVV